MTSSEQGVEPRTGPSEPDLQSRALALFDATSAAHGLLPATRWLLQFATAFYTAARHANPDRTARGGRDLALAEPIPGLTPDEQAIVASVVALQRDKPRPQREPVFWRLDEPSQRTAVRLAAILQVAGGLAAEPAGGLAAQVTEDGTILVLGGERAAEAAEAATARCELWRAGIGALTLRPSEPGEPVAPIAAANGAGVALTIHAVPPDRLDGGEPIAEGARRVLRRFFGRLLAREENVLKDDDPDDVHEMRVASRRLRAAFQVVETIYDPAELRRYRRGLRRVTAALADMRDLDVFREHVVTYQAGLPEEARAGIDPLIAAIEERRAEARAVLLDDLQQRRYRKFKRALAPFLTTAGAGVAAQDGVDPTMRVRDFAGSAIWRRYELWRANEVGLATASDEQLHEARIAGKRLRYTLEFFADALGRNVETVLAPLVALQGCLGDMQDAVVARQRIQMLGLDGQDAIQAYIQAREAESAERREELPRLWEKVASATYRRRLAELIVKL